VSDEATYRPKPLIPRSPTEVRDEMVRHRKGFAERAGVETSARSIERLVLTDLDIVEALKRGADPTRATSKGTTKRPPPAPPELPGDMVLRRGGRGAPKFERLPLLHSNPMRIGVKWSSAVARIGRIREGMQPAPSVEESLKTARCPDLALEWFKLYAAYRMRHRQSRFNPFRGMSEKDAARALMRGAFDICDRSTGRLGAWF